MGKGDASLFGDKVPLRCISGPEKGPKSLGEDFVRGNVSTTKQLKTKILSAKSLGDGEPGLNRFFSKYRVPDYMEHDVHCEHRKANIIRVEPFTEHYIEEATLMFSAAYRCQRLSIPEMPFCHEDPTTIMPLLSDLSTHNSGAVAVSDEKMAGYLLGMHLPEFKSPYPGVYCPEWAHAAAPGMEDAVYAALFEYISPYWVSSGAASFAVSVMAGNQSAINAWYWNGFGLAVIDAVSPPTPIDTNAPPDMLIRQATDNDLAAVTTLLADHRRYMITPPVSLVVNIDISHEGIRNRINRPEHMLWLAEVQGEAVGILEAADSVSGASHIVSGGRGIGIKCAHVLPEWRGKGIASALLYTAFSWASSLGIKLCSVDFEAFNPTARRFWLRYFSPVCFSLVRRIDERSIVE